MMKANATTTTSTIEPAPRTPARDRPECIYDYTLENLTEWMQEHGQPAFRAKQVYTWLYQHLATSYDEMTVLQLGLREELSRELPLNPLTPIREILTDDDQTLKVLYQTADGQTLETVLMFYPNRVTVCLSCQVGCAVGCSFCATGMGGLQRNLTAGEMVAQMVDMARRAGERDRSLTNMVMMGMGEPFHNYQATMKMVGILNDQRGFGFGARRITISTSGVVPFIDKLAEEPYQVNLAISIHAGNDELRSSLVPLNDRWPIDDLLAACRRYIDRTGRRVSFEYALLSGVNSSDEHAREMAARLKGLLCHVNVIPYNPTPGAFFERPTREGSERFAEVLREEGIQATVRYSRGVDIAAACGQLRTQHQAPSKPGA